MHIFGTKTTWKIFWTILVAQGGQILVDVIVEKIKKFHNFEFQGCNTPQMKAENKYSSNWAWKSRVFYQKKKEKIKIFRFSPFAWGPPNIFDVPFFQFFEKQIPKLAFWDLANIKRKKVRNFGYNSPDLVAAADRFMVGGS